MHFVRRTKRNEKHQNRCQNNKKPGDKIMIGAKKISNSKYSVFHEKVSLSLIENFLNCSN
ncbi:hypothetical protein HpNP104_07730 [Helicobacter pylori]